MTQRQSNIYPNNHCETDSNYDVIHPGEIASLYELYCERLKRTPDKIAFTEYDELNCVWVSYSWQEMFTQIQRWRSGFIAQGLVKGDVAAILLKNCCDWVCFDMACSAQGIVSVPLYMDDRAENMAFIMREVDARFLLIDSASHWQQLCVEKSDDIKSLDCVVVRQEFEHSDDARVISKSAWLAKGESSSVSSVDIDGDELASIVYTSGTTGRPKGVMLSHHNFIHNAYGGACSVNVKFVKRTISFLPLSHTLERCVGYYLMIIVGVEMAYARSITTLKNDLLEIKPTCMIAVPRIFERFSNKVMTSLDEGPKLKKLLFTLAVDVGWHRFEYLAGRRSWHPKLLLASILDKKVGQKIRAVFGGELAMAVSGGAPLSYDVAKTFIALRIIILQGYGLTETSPMLTANNFEHNKPESIGLPLPNVQLKLSDDDELLAKGPNVMKGYWKNDKATEDTFTKDGWLKTGDLARFDKDGYCYIIGRLKDIMVLATGEKVPPADIETAIQGDPLIEQAMLIGEGRPYLSVLVVLDKLQWEKIAPQFNGLSDDAFDGSSKEIQDFLLSRIEPLLKDFPGYAQIYKICPMLNPWTIEDGLQTPTMKLKRPAMLEKFKIEIEKLYSSP